MLIHHLPSTNFEGAIKMKKLIFSLVLSISIPCSTFAEQTFTVFGPEKITRETGTPINIVKEFTIQDVNREYRLDIQNGEGKRGRISSAVVKLNDSLIVGPSSFNKQVENVSTMVKLLKSNKLEIEVRSQPGTFIMVKIVGIGNPPVSPITGLTIKPDGFPINTPTVVTFNATIPYPADKPVPVVELITVTTDGTPISIEGAMLDNGQLSNGDEIQGDGIFSFRKVYNIPQACNIYLQIRANIEGEVQHSETFCLNIFKPITDAEVDEMNSIDISAEQMFNQLLATKSKEEAIAAVLAYYKSQSIVKDAGVSVSGIWVIYTNGMEGGFSFNTPGTKGGSLPLFSESYSVNSNISITANAAGQPNTVKSNKVLILAAFLDEFAADDDAPEVKTIFESHNNAGDCPKYDIVYLSNTQCGIGSFKALGSYGIVHVSSHGEYINNRVVLYSKTAANAANMQTYQVDLNSNPVRLVRRTINGRTWLAATPAFFRYYIQSFPSTLVFLSSCHSSHDNSMWNSFNYRGAKAFLGFSDLVPAAFAKNKATYFYDKWINDPINLTTTGQIFNGGCSAGACWNLLGANDLEAPSGELKDGSFELGALATWNPEGDGRIIPQLGSFSPTDGSKMGLISTGLGFTDNSGSISQKFCIPANATTLTLDWNFISEEFREYCGSIFQDFFRIDIITENGAVYNLFYKAVDDVCGSTFQVPFSFDVGDVWATGWNNVSLDISAIAAANAGKSVTLKLSAGDVGDSIYDTAILVDNIKIATP